MRGTASSTGGRTPGLGRSAALRRPDAVVRAEARLGPAWAEEAGVGGTGLDPACTAGAEAADAEARGAGPAGAGAAEVAARGAKAADSGAATARNDKQERPHPLPIMCRRRSTQRLE